MKFFSITALILLFTTSIFAQDSTSYKLIVDIKNIENDQVTVTLNVPQITSDTTVYCMPKIIPGTYSISDFGRFVVDLKAIDNDGKELEVNRLDTNRWEIIGATNLDHLTYRVNDTFDEPRGGGIFEPGGTNIEAGKNVVLNMFGFAGYLDGYKNLPYEVEIVRPENFHGETSLYNISRGDTSDHYLAKDYFQLHDCPILYCEPDTAAMYVDDTRIAVSVYSPTGVVSAEEVMKEIEELFPAASKYLGGDLPADRYSILIYLTSSFGSGGYGALEHHTSTVCVLPEAPVASLSQTIKDVTAHEFFHIVTPLNIHSEEINDYDFVNPVMSQHLWLYEGCTEYAAQHVQVKYGLMSQDEFMDVMKGKIMAASRFDSGIAFTEISKKALDEHADQYLNVYQQGALIGMAVDLKLLNLSEGAYGIQDLMRDMSAEYGENVPFKDEELFSEMGRVSGYAELTEFLEKHVGGTDPIPFDELLGYAGVKYAEESTREVITGGNVALGFNPKTGRMVVVNTQGLDDFGKEMGYERGDEIVSWDGMEINSENYREVLKEFKKNTEEGDKVKVVVARKEGPGEYKNVTLKAKALKVEKTFYNELEIVENPGEQEAKIRQAWLKGA